MVLRKLAANWLLMLTAVISGSLECNVAQLTAREQHGRELFGQMCAVCHGARGEGYVADHAPAIGKALYLATVSDAMLADAIGQGRTDTTMSAWSLTRGGPLSSSDVRDVVAYLRWEQGQAHVDLDEAPLRGNARNGAELFDRQCAACHGKDGRGGPYVHVGNADFLRTATTGMLRYAIREGRPGTPMPAFGAKLSASQIDDLVVQLRTTAVLAAPVPPIAEANPPPIPLGPVPLNPRGGEPEGFVAHPGKTPVAKVKAALDAGKRVVILDSRTPSDYLHEHIKGAVSVPFYDPTPYFDKLPKDTWMVAYCACPSAKSEALATKLMQNGFKKVTVLAEGYGLWKSSNYGVSTGTEP